MSGLTRSEFEAIWAELDAQEAANKLSTYTVIRLSNIYRKLDPDDQVLVDKFEIRSALPALHAQLDSLEHAVGPSIPFDRKKIGAIIRRLEGE